MTKAQYDLIRRDAHHLALEIGVRPAARALGLSESRVQKWSYRQKWNIKAIRPPAISKGGNGIQPWEPGGTNGSIEAKLNILAKLSDRTKVNAAVAADKAFDHLAGMPNPELMKPATAISSEQWSKVADRTHGWTQSRAANANVNVAVQVNLPSAEEIAERRAQHKQLDAITALINSEG